MPEKPRSSRAIEHSTLVDLLHESFTLTLALSPRRGNKRKQESLAPFSLGRRVSEGFAPLREEGDLDSRRRSSEQR